MYLTLPFSPGAQLVSPRSFWIVLGEHNHTTGAETNRTEKFEVGSVFSESRCVASRASNEGQKVSEDFTITEKKR